MIFLLKTSDKVFISFFDNIASYVVIKLERLLKKRKTIRLSVVLSFLFVGLIMVAVLIIDQVQRLFLFGIYALAVIIIYAIYIWRLKDIYGETYG